MWDRSRSRVREKDFVIGSRHKDLCGWCYSGDEEEAAGKSCQRRIMGELGALPILVIPRLVDFRTVGKGCLCVCVGSFSFFCPCSWGSGDLSHALLWCWPLEGCQGNRGPAPEMYPEERRVGDSGCLLRHRTPSPLRGKGSQRPLSPTAEILLIISLLDRAVSPSRSSGCSQYSPGSEMVSAAQVPPKYTPVGQGECKPLGPSRLSTIWVASCRSPG